MASMCKRLPRAITDPVISKTITCDRNRSRVKVNTLLHCSIASTLTSAALHHMTPDNYCRPFVGHVMRIHVVLSATLGIRIEAPRERALVFSIDCRTMLVVVRADMMIECMRTQFQSMMASRGCGLGRSSSFAVCLPCSEAARSRRLGVRAVFQCGRSDGHVCCCI